MRRVVSAFAILSCVLLASRSDYVSAKQKFDGIENFRFKPGSRVTIGSNEINAWVQEELPKYAPAGVREPRVELPGDNLATGSAKINFLVLRRAQGKQPGWFMRKLLDGERDVSVTTMVESGRGQATVHLRSVEISGIPIEGAALDFLLDYYLRPNYPKAKIGEPIELHYGMERLEVKPGRVDVVLAAKRQAMSNPR